MVNLPRSVLAKEVAIMPLHLANGHHAFMSCLKLVHIHSQAVELAHNGEEERSLHLCINSERIALHGYSTTDSPLVRNNGLLA